MKLENQASDILITTLRIYITDMLQTSIELTEHSKRMKLKEKVPIFYKFLFFFHFFPIFLL